MEGTAPAAGYVPPQSYPQNPPQNPPPTGYQQFMDQGLGVKVQPGPSTGPNPTVAGILGAIPLGLGAVYCGQYAKGLAHLGIFVLAIVGFSYELPWQGYTAIGIFLGFFWVYQILDSVRTAKALQAGEPTPDPFGLAQTFSSGDKVESTKVPAAAAILIGLGVLFLLHTVGLFDIGIGHFVSLILIVLGVWLFAKHWGLLGTHRPACVCERCRASKLMGPAILVTLGVVFLIGFFKAWPAILLVVGAVKLMQSNASTNGHMGSFPPNMPPAVPPEFPQNAGPTEPQNPEQTASSGEVNHV
jgi:hypothetical protein